ncbi:threonine dehydratase [Burkholderia pseudomallei]|nr:threonine dehydratase [Burkholderia pseudomallei]
MTFAAPAARGRRRVGGVASAGCVARGSRLGVAPARAFAFVRVPDGAFVVAQARRRQPLAEREQRAEQRREIVRAHRQRALLRADEAQVGHLREQRRIRLAAQRSLAVAGAKRYAEQAGIEGETLVAVTSGANMNFDRMRFVAERAEVGEAREAVFAVTIPEERGSFKRFCALVGERNVTEFNYRIADARSAHLFVGVQIRRRDESDEIAANFAAHGFTSVDLSGDELSKQHIRYMVGGRSPLAHDERLFRFEFPERPGALMKFLSSMAPDWNISLFHYRNQGADYSSILVGLQVPQADHAEFDRFLAALGYPFWEESGNPAYRLFLS